MSPGQGQFFFKVSTGKGQGHRSKVFFLYEWEALSQETYLLNMKALSETVQKLWPMYIFLK